MGDAELLAGMLEGHMVVNGEIYLRCTLCKARPVPHDQAVISFVQACDECLEAALGTTRTTPA